MSGGIFTGQFTKLERSLSVFGRRLRRLLCRQKTFSHLSPSFLFYAEKDIARQSPLATPLQKCLSWRGYVMQQRGSNLHIPFAQSKLPLHLPTALWSKSRAPLNNLDRPFPRTGLRNCRALTPNGIGLRAMYLVFDQLRTMLLKGSESQPLQSNGPMRRGLQVIN